MQRKEMSRSGRSGGMPQTPTYPSYTAPARPAVTDTYDSYAAEKNKSFKSAPKGKGMQLGKKSKTTDMFERVRGDLGPEAEESAPLVSQSSVAPELPSARDSTAIDREPIHITVAEQIIARLSREGTLKSFEVKGDLQLRVSDPSLTKVKLDLIAEASHGAQFKTHPNVDRALFNSSKAIQTKDPSRGFPPNISVGVLRWNFKAKSDDSEILPITFTVWVNRGSGDSYSITVEYELTGGDALKDVAVTIPFSTTEPHVSSFDANYEVAGDSLEWTIGNVDEENSSGAFEFEAQADDENEFFPMSVRFAKTTPFMGVDVSILAVPFHI
jgi:coatomer subunit delta